ncbi:MAG: shikimate kinase [Candidatus Amulumruptor caecigallinarius]|nr:shikimate kinase [Candidatus Amulumruptor caecigallinarius]
MSKKPIFIVGYMASGKTTFGRALSKALGRDFIDLDFYIEQRFRKTINEIFEERGENSFRRMESCMLEEVSAFENAVVACGGGTPCFGNNMDVMLESGIVVWLQASRQRILDRLLANNSRRPLMRGKSRAEIEAGIVEGLGARERHYSRAQIIYSGENLETHAQIDSAIQSFINKYEF